MSSGGDFAISGNTLYATTAPGIINGQPAATSDLYALDATTGKEEWAVPVSGTPDQPAVANGVVYVGGAIRPAPHQYDAILSAVDATTGNLLWQSTSGAANSPIVTNGMVIDAANGQSSGGILAFSLPTEPSQAAALVTEPLQR